ncbi:MULTISPECIES: YhgE/Pip domain-containing protein [Nocardiopsis]|uniref:YhgE/Pip domain-containing protein n=1 Tax=Nocardiopsis TaxID=2013 RepID=UPI00036384C3|nr:MULTISPECIES: YhgE/Pip domain-containing protein [Nocardiopsis]MEC3894987.1 YhgE/Pip domain-containing protein [Nocardiopsis sp. LDBS1602]
MRSFLRSPLPTAALAALMLIPLLYSGMYLWSFWDPFDRMEHLPVALVNEDTGAEVDGEEVDIGGELADTLLERGDLDWHLVDAAEAARGLDDGDYYVTLTIPSHFSQALTSPSRDRENPTPALLVANYNDSNSYIVRQLAGSAFKEIRETAASTAIGDYLDQIFLGFNEIHGKTEEAADGAGQLADGAGDAESGSGELSEGIGEAHTGAGSLSGGLSELYSGSEELAEGAGSASDQVSAKVERLDELADDLLPRLEEDIPDIQARAETIADVTDGVSQALTRLPEEIDVSGMEAVDGRLDTFLEENPDLEKDQPDLYALLTDLDDAMGTALSVAGFVNDNRDEIDSTAAEAAALSERAVEVADDLPNTVSKAEDARDQIDALAEGLEELAEGSRKIRDGLSDASSGASDLDSGLGELSGGADRLHDGLGDLSSGSEELADGLNDGVDEIPTYSDSGRADAADMMSEPVRLDSEVDNEVPNYGTGFAPFFVPLSLWVGAMVVFMVLPALSNRGLASSSPSWRVALAGRMVPMMLGWAQVLVMMGVLHVGLGLESRNWPLMLAFLLLTASAFAATVQFLTVRFGAAGRVIALALLVLQLTSAGGTYPIETSPTFFQAIAPYLPLHWGVTAMRHLIGGGDMNVVAQAFGVMGLWLVVPLLLTWLAVARKRVWSMSTLYPALKV